ncbi:NifU family protein [Patescibacteria group bacterium]
MIDEIKKIIEEIKPSIQLHGGDVEFIEFDTKSKIVKVRLKGACAHCPMSEITLKENILSAIKEKCPDVKGIVKD